MSAPTKRVMVEAAFNSLPGDATYVWTDITDYVRDDALTSVRRGRQDTTQKFGPGVFTTLLDNRLAYFEALNSSGPYYGKLLPMIPIRYSQEYPWLPGLLNDGAFRKGIADFVAFTGCSSQAQVAPTNVLTRGACRLTASGAGSFYAGTDYIPVDASRIGTNVAYSIRAHPQSFGASPTCFTEVEFLNSSHTHISTAQVTAVCPDNTETRISNTAVVPANTAYIVFRFGSNTGGAGKVVDYNSAVIDYATWSWASHFVGYADSWKCTSVIGDSVCELQASDGLKPLGFANMNSPLFGDYLRGLGATKWYRFGETANGVALDGLRMKDEITGALDASVYIGTGAGPLPGIAGCSPLDPDFGFSTLGPSSLDNGGIVLPKTAQPSGTSWTVNIWFRSPNGGYGDSSALTWIWGAGWGDGSGNTSDEFVFIGVSNLGHVTCQVSHPTTPVRGTGTYTSIQNVCVDRLWHMLTLRYDETGNDLDLLIDGLLDGTATPDGGGGCILPAAKYTPIVGSYFGNAWQGPYYSNMKTSNLSDANVGFEVDEYQLFNGTLLSDGAVSALYVQGKLAYPEEPAGKRMDRTMDLANWSSGMRNIDVTKGVTVARVVSPFFRANALRYAQLIEDSDGGFFFPARDGRMTFIPLETQLVAGQVWSASQYTFGNGGGSEIPFEDAPTINDDTLLYTQAQTSIQAQTEATSGTGDAVGGTIHFADASDETQFLIRPLSKTNLLLRYDNEAQDMADWLAALFSQTGTRITELVVNPYVSEAAFLACQAIEVGWIVTVRLRLPGMSSVDVPVQVQGVQEDTQRGKSRIRFSVNSVYAQPYMNFGDNFNTHDMGF